MAKRTSFSRFAIIWLIAVIALVASGLALNIRHDATGILAALSLRPVRPTAGDLWSAAAGLYPIRSGQREGKVFNAVWYKPQVAIFGSSNVWSYVDTQNPRLRQPDGRAAYNFGVAGVTMFEVEAAFRHVVALGNLRRAVAGLEFFMFAGNRTIPGGIDTMPLAHQSQYGKGLWGYMSHHVISLGALQKSFWALLQDLVPAASAAESSPRQALDDERLREMIHRADREQTTALYRSDQPFLFTDAKGRSTFDALRSMIALAQRAGVRLDLYLTPHHARAYELVRAIGLWPKYQAWLRELANIADETGVCIVDFGSYSDLTTNTEAATGPGAVFRTHPDSIHMSAELGTRIIDSLSAGSCSSTLKEGTLLSKRAIEGYLELVEDRREAFVRANPAFVDDVAALARALPHRTQVLNQTSSLVR